MRSRMALVMLLTVMTTVSAGCRSGLLTSPFRPSMHLTCVDDLHARKKARHLACAALLRCYPRSSYDFKEGFEAAYVDILEGADGCPPGVPPERYWNTCFRTPRGHARAADWYAGYQAGVASAQAEGLSEFNYVPTSVKP